MVNNVTIMGRLTSDPELRQTANGVATCSFTVAVERNYTPQGQDKQTDFIPVVAWRQTAEFVSKYFSKGKLIAVVGALRTRSYDDKRYPDVKHYVMELYAESVSFCGDKFPSGNAAPTQQAQYAQPVQQTAAPVQQESFGGFEGIIGNGDLPF